MFCDTDTDAWGWKQDDPREMEGGVGGGSGLELYTPTGFMSTWQNQYILEVK